MFYHRSIKVLCVVCESPFLLIRYILQSNWWSLEPPGLRWLLLLLWVMMHTLIATSHGRGNWGRCALLNLQQERGVLDLDESIHILESGFHECNLRLDWVVAEGNRLTNDLFTACHEVSWKKLDELILNVLYKVEFCCTISAHDEHG